jgi:hypothetical protein
MRIAHKQEVIEAARVWYTDERRKDAFLDALAHDRRQ